MIILYAITGFVSLLFCIVILTGAIRAFRHPERYGPRQYNPDVDGPDGQGQSRAAGITRAILDTFPVVKFGRTGPDMPYPLAEDLPSPKKDLERHSFSTLDDRSDRHHGRTGSAQINGENVQFATRQPRASTSNATPLSPEAIGRETCPICIVDFEVGDDLRVLPCEGKHRFHRDCVDPWLLELSSSCPICRQDFHVLEEMVAEGMLEEDREEARDQAPQTTHSRFSKYLYFARKKRRSQQQGVEPPPSDFAPDGSRPAPSGP